MKGRRWLSGAQSACGASPSAANRAGGVGRGVASLCALALSVTIAPLAWAQGVSSAPEDPAYQSKSMTDARGKKIQVVDFNEAHIEGKAKGPDGFVLQSRQGGSFKNILELRRNFRGQIQSSSFEAMVGAPTGD